jgi:hypothetical protein
MGYDFNQYEFYIFSFSWEQDKLPESALYTTNKKKILIYISDESSNVPYYLSTYYFAIFKVHLQSNKFLVDNIFNFPLGCVKDVPQLPVININNRKYSVFFIGNLNENRLSFFYYLLFGKIPNRMLHICIRLIIKLKFLKKIFTLLKFDNKYSNSFIRFTGGFKNGIPPEKYGEIIADSKIVLCPKGFQFTECFRHYEAMRAGCVIISEKLPPTYFYKDSPIIQISDWKEGLKVANELINNNEELERLSKATINWWKNKCSEDAVAQYVADTITSNFES